MSEHGWLVCSPGDPNDEQWNAGWEIAGKDNLCITKWNADTGDVIAAIDRYIEDQTVEIIYWLIHPNGDADLITNESEVTNG